MRRMNTSIENVRSKNVYNDIHNPIMYINIKELRTNRKHIPAKVYGITLKRCR